MSHLPRPLGSRITVLAATLAVSFAALTVPSGLAREDPTAPIQRVLLAIEAKDSGAIADEFCEEFASEAGNLDFASKMSKELPSGVEADQMLAAFSFEVDELGISPMGEPVDGEVDVSVSASVATTVDPEGITPLIEALLAVSGEEVTEDMVATMSEMMVSQFESQTQDINATVTVRQSEAGPYQICSQVGGIGEGGDAASTDAAASTEG